MYSHLSAGCEFESHEASRALVGSGLRRRGSLSAAIMGTNQGTNRPRKNADHGRGSTPKGQSGCRRYQQAGRGTRPESSTSESCPASRPRLLVNTAQPDGAAPWLAWNRIAYALSPADFTRAPG